MNEAVTNKTENERGTNSSVAHAPRQLGTDLLCLVFGIFSFGLAVYRAAIFTRHSPPAVTSHDPFFIALLAGLAVFIVHANRHAVFPRIVTPEPSIVRVLGLAFAYFALAGIVIYYASAYGLEALTRFYIRRYD